MKKTITPQSKSFPDWYQDVVREAELAEPSEVRGCGIVKPYGYAIWELIKKELSERIEATGAQNAYFPIFVPIENLEAEAEHVEGFAPELAVVTHGGGEELTQKLAVRPTSETAMYKTYAKWIQSYRDLPLRLNQWNNVVRWEKRPRAFLRWSEFQWQEGHSAFADKDAAVAEVWDMLDIYESMYEHMAIPVFKGKKSEMEKFAGADMTTTVEIMSKDGKAIQGATSHYLGTNFAKVFDVKYAGEDGEERYAYQTSWGMSWRSIGALIMSHGDDDGLRLPPNVAPIQIVIVPFIKDENKDAILQEANALKEKLSAYRTHVDERDGMNFGFKLNEWEVKGVPVRLEIGEKEISEKSVTMFRRDTGEKEKMSIETCIASMDNIMQSVHDTLYANAKRFADEHVHRIESIDEINEQTGFFAASWCETKVSEKILKEKYAMVSRLQLKENRGKKPTNANCFITGEPAKGDWLFAKSY